MANCVSCGKKLGWTDFKGKIDGLVFCKEHYEQRMNQQKPEQNKKKIDAVFEFSSATLVDGEQVIMRGKWPAKLWGGSKKGEVEIILTNFRLINCSSDTYATDDMMLYEIDDVVVVHVKSERDSYHAGMFTGTRGFGVGSYGGQSWGTSQQVGDISIMSHGQIALELPDIRDPHGLRRVIISVKKQTKPTPSQEIEMFRQRLKHYEEKVMKGMMADDEGLQQLREQINTLIMSLEHQKEEEAKERETKKKLEAIRTTSINAVDDLLRIGYGDRDFLLAMKSDLEAGRTLREADLKVIEGWLHKLEGSEALDNKEAVASKVQPEMKKAYTKEDVFGQLKKLADLRDSGIITNEEFEAKKKELLSRI